MWVSVGIGAGRVELGGGDDGLVDGDSVVSAHCGFGGDLPGPDPVADRLGGHSEESGGFCGGDVFGVHGTQQYTRAQRTQGPVCGRARTPGG